MLSILLQFTFLTSDYKNSLLPVEFLLYFIQCDLLFAVINGP